MLIMTPASHQNDPETSAELADITGLCRVMLARRLGEVAIRGESRKCAVNGTQAVTWGMGND